MSEVRENNVDKQRFKVVLICIPTTKRVKKNHETKKIVSVLALVYFLNFTRVKLSKYK